MAQGESAPPSDEGPGEPAQDDPGSPDLADDEGEVDELDARARRFVLRDGEFNFYPPGTTPPPRTDGR